MLSNTETVLRPFSTIICIYFDSYCASKYMNRVLQLMGRHVTDKFLKISYWLAVPVGRCDVHDSVYKQSLKCTVPSWQAREDNISIKQWKNRDILLSSRKFEIDLLGDQNFQCRVEDFQDGGRHQPWGWGGGTIMGRKISWKLHENERGWRGWKGHTSLAFPLDLLHTKQDNVCDDVASGRKKTISPLGTVLVFNY